MSMNMDELLALVQGKRAEIKARSGDYNNAEKIPAGKSRWRILPGWKTPVKFFHEFAQHFIKDKDGNVKVVYVCENKTFGRPCGVCDVLGDAMRATKGDDKVLKLLGESKSRFTYLVNALRMDGENKNPKKPVLLQVPTKVMDDYMALMGERAGDDIAILDAENGRDMVITREGSGFNTEYKLNDAASNTAVDPEALKALIDIDAWIDNELRKGIAKGTALLESTLKTITSIPITTTARISGPSVASLVPSSRVIEVEVEDAVTEVAVAPAAPAAAAPAPAAQASAPAVAPAASGVAGGMDDEELAALLKSLD
jgi:hypothetical protein